MRPLKLTLSAWGPYVDEVVIPFEKLNERGLFLITGTTGSGKTMLFDGVVFALYGRMSGEIRECKNARSDFAGHNTKTYVKLEFTHRGQTYLIERSPKYLRPSKRVSKEGEIKEVEEKERAVLTMPDGRVIEGNSLVNEEIEQILGFDYKQFKQTTMLAQGEFAKLLFAKTEDKIKIFRSIFDTELFERFLRIIKENARELHKREGVLCNKMDESISHLELPSEKWQEFLAQDKYPYEQVISFLEEYKKELSRQSKEKKQLLLQYEKSYDEYLKRLERAKTEAETMKKKERTEKELAKYKLEEEDIKFLENQLNLARKASELEGSYVRITGSREDLDHAQKRTESLEKNLKDESDKRDRFKPIIDDYEFYKDAFTKRELLINLEGELKNTSKQSRLADKELEKFQKEYLEKDTQLKGKRAEYDNIQNMRRLAAIGIAAEGLIEGKPCPVCGSTSHPKPAKLLSDMPSEQEIKELQSLVEKLDKEVSTAHEQAVRNKEKADSLQKEVDKIASDIEKSHSELCKLEKEHHQKLKALIQLVAEQRKGTPRELLEANLTQLNNLNDGLEDIKNIYADLEKNCYSIDQQYKEALNNQKDKFKMTEELQAVWLEELKKAGFLEESEFIENKRSAKECHEMESKMQDYRRNLYNLEERFKELVRECSKIKSVDITELEQEVSKAEKDKKEASGEKEKVSLKENECKKTLNSLKEKISEYKSIQVEYGDVKRLENAASGNNDKRLVFEQFVLSGYFDEILEAGNLRLQKMTGSRYLMKRVANVGDGRKKDNLEIEIFDYYTGKSRGVKTLSGGETFKASLALSLGLSDIVQRSKGGISVETLFIDEGFGSLDAKSLEQAIKVLYELAGENHFIGIISHVDMLREQILSQIQVTKTPEGSGVNVV